MCGSADNPLAFDAFLSILFAPQASAGSFDEMLRSIQRHQLPMLLIYGREDPWVRTIWGQRIVRVVPEATFFQVCGDSVPRCQCLSGDTADGGGRDVHHLGPAHCARSAHAQGDILPGVLSSVLVHFRLCSRGLCVAVLLASCCAVC